MTPTRFQFITPARAFMLVFVLCWGIAGWQIAAQQGSAFDSANQADLALKTALIEQSKSRQRAERLEAQARAATAAADRTAQEAAAVAARIQEAEAQIAAANARIAVIERQKAALRNRIAVKQEPIVRLTAAVQLMARRPLVLALLHPGSLEETVHMRAVLETIVPEVEKRTAGLKAEVARSRALQASVRDAQQNLRESRSTLSDRRRQLASVEARQRLESRAAMGTANREVDRALALAEEARDLRGLLVQLEKDGALRAQLAALPGPVLRPSDPTRANSVSLTQPAAEQPGKGISYILPVSGRLVTGFGEKLASGPAAGTTLAPQSGAQVVAPAAGRIAFAGPYRGYGRIIIIEHPNGWTSLITQLGRVDVMVGQQVVQGAPLGQAEQSQRQGAQPLLTVELRKDGTPVNVMSVIGG